MCFGAVAIGMSIWTDETKSNETWGMQLCLVLDAVIYVSGCDLGQVQACFLQPWCTGIFPPMVLFLGSPIPRTQHLPQDDRCCV